MINSEKNTEVEVEELTECSECKSEHIVRDYKRGEVTCSNCGLVVDDQVIDQGPEWRAFDSEQNERRARGGAPMTVMVHDKGLSTDIGWGGRDIYGNNVPTKNRSQVYRMRKWQNRTRASNSADRNLAFPLIILIFLCFAKDLIPELNRFTREFFHKLIFLKSTIGFLNIKPVFFDSCVSSMIFD